MSQDTTMGGGHRPAGTEDLLVGSPRSDAPRPADDRLDDADRVEGTDRSADADRLDDVDRPEDNDRLADADRPEDADRLADTDRPEDADRLEGTDRPEDADQWGHDRVLTDRTPADDRLDDSDRMIGDDRIPDTDRGLDAGVPPDADRLPGDEVRVGEDDQLRNGEQLPDGLDDGTLPSAVDHAPPSQDLDHDHAAQLFDSTEVDGFRTRWMELQAAFVDEPRAAVQQADQLVAEVMQTLAATFARNKQELEGQWQREGTADTEDLRQALRRYRAFFDQLLRT